MFYRAITVHQASTVGDFSESLSSPAISNVSEGLSPIDVGRLYCEVDMIVANIPVSSPVGWVFALLDVKRNTSVG